MKNYDRWFKRLAEEAKLCQWVSEMKAHSSEWFAETKRGDVGKWKAALSDLPKAEKAGFRVEEKRLYFSEQDLVKQDLLKAFHPWRKGPLQIGKTFIDTEWRSDWKWERVAPHLNLEGRKVLDIGCGNGYYLWRMLEQGAEWALGIDPYIPYVMQFQCMQHFAGFDDRAEIFPIGVEALPRIAPVFDTVFSMGVLYHQKSPIEHLMHCRDLLAKDGELILETIVLPPSAEERECLVPEGRYAKMKNVYFLPSVEMLSSWLRKVRFKSVEVLDLCQTTTAEQRSTDWMTFESLEHYLNPEDHDRTIEGHPCPWRVVIRAKLS